MKFELIPLAKIIIVPSPPKKTGEVDQIHPIKVRPTGDMFEIVDGHGRVSVAIGNGEIEIWAQIQELDDETFHLQSLAANLSSRENPLKMARDIDELISMGHSQSEISRMIGGDISQSRISQLHSLMSLTDDLQDKIATGDCPVKAALIAVELPAELQDELAQAERITIALAKQIRDEFKNDSFSLDNLPEIPDVYQKTSNNLVLNGSTFDRLAQGEVIEMMWEGLKVQVRCV